LVRFSDASVLLAASLIERVPDVQDALTATSDHNHLLANIVGGCIAFGMLNTADGYKIRVLKNFQKQIKRLGISLATGTAGVYFSLVIMHHDRLELVTGSLRWCVLSTVALMAARTISTVAIKSWTATGKLAKRVALVGVDQVTQLFINNAERHKDTCNIIGLYTDHPTSQTMQGSVKVIGPISQILFDSQVEKFDSVVISQGQPKNDFTAIYQQVLPVIADIQLIGRTFIGNLPRDKLTDIGGNLVVTVKRRPLTDWQNLYKTIFDKVIALIALMCLSPLMLLTAIVIRIDSPGKVLFKQPRIGYNNLPFVTYKFRSMYIDKADIQADRQTTKGDDRITRIGKIIRRFSIDELPQIFNVLEGNMSLVGPRPHAPGTKAGDRLFAEVVSEYAQRHKVKPGITGLAQINGYRGDTPDEDSIKRRVEYDLQYIETWSLWLDIRIIVLTVFREILSKKAF
jgi:Undecaprenyl-phosphate glucose phosphotransferase